MQEDTLSLTHTHIVFFWRTEIGRTPPTARWCPSGLVKSGCNTHIQDKVCHCDIHTHTTYTDAHTSISFFYSPRGRVCYRQAGVLMWLTSHKCWEGCPTLPLRFGIRPPGDVPTSLLQFLMGCCRWRCSCLKMVGTTVPWLWVLWWRCLGDRGVYPCLCVWFCWSSLVMKCKRAFGGWPCLYAATKRLGLQLAYLQLQKQDETIRIGTNEPTGKLDIMGNVIVSGGITDDGSDKNYHWIKKMNWMIIYYL